MGTFDAKYGAYERAMQQNNYWGLTGDARGEQLGRYSVGLQQDEIKAANRAAGRDFAKQLATERRQFAAAEQTALTEGISGKTAPAPVQTQTPVTAPITEPVTTNSQPASQQQKAVDKIKVAKKMKVGTAKTGFKFYLIDKQGNTYQVDKKTYNAAKKGKMASIAGATTVDTTSPKVARKVKNASGKIKKNKIRLITDPKAYHNQRQNMYNNLMGKGEQVPMHNYNVVNDSVAYNNQRQAMYNSLMGKGKQVPMHNYRIVNDTNTYRLQQQDMYSKLFSSSESHIIEAKGDIRRLETKLADANRQILQSVENNGKRIGLLNNKVTTLTETISAQSRNISSLERTIAQNTQAMGRMERAIASQGDDIASLTNKLSRTNKRVALAAGLAAIVAGGIGYLIAKLDDKNNIQQYQTPINEHNPSNLEELSEEDKPLQTSENVASSAIINQASSTEQSNSTVDENQTLPTEQANLTTVANQTLVTEQTDSVTSLNLASVGTGVELKDTIQEARQSQAIIENQQEDSKNHKVIDGDNCWNIAKEELKKEYKNAGKDPNTVTDKEIRKRTEKIIDANRLKWEADGYTVIIHPGDKLDVAA